MIKAILVEDSRLARMELEQMLKDFSDIDIVAQAANVDEALIEIEKHKPDLIFLDINMPEKDGFDLLDALVELPQVIFTTAYDEYAIKSFEYNALDYLLKPIKSERLAQAIAKVKHQIEEEESPSTPLTDTSPIFIKDGEKCWLVKIEEVILFESVGNYTKVYFNDQKPMTYKPLTKIEERLDQQSFFRANRQHLVNLRKVEQVEPSISGGFDLTLANGILVSVSRRKAQDFKKMLSL